MPLPFYFFNLKVSILLKVSEFSSRLLHSNKVHMQLLADIFSRGTQFNGVRMHVCMYCKIKPVMYCSIILMRQFKRLVHWLVFAPTPCFM